MKTIIIAVLGLVIIAGGALAITKNKSSNQRSEDTVITNTDSEQSKGKAACALLTLDDAKDVIGDKASLSEDKGDPTSATNGVVDIDNCTYSADGATIGDFTQITIQRHYGDKAQVKQAYENYKKEFPGEELSGLGDEAYYATGAKQVQALKGGYWLYITGGSINAGDAANKELELKAARLVLSKL